MQAIEATSSTMRPKQWRAIELRRLETDAEERAWRLLRGRRIAGFKFRRQHPISGFIVDFYCFELHLVVEIDGPIHDEPDQRGSDRERDAILKGLGLQVVRVRNDEVSGPRFDAIVEESNRPRGSPLSRFTGEGQG